MELKEAIYSRRAVREYTADPVDARTIRQLIDAAVQAPSAVNEQPWAFWVVRDRSILSQISKEAKAYVLQTPPVGVASHHLRELETDPDFDILYHAPVLIVISSVSDNQWTIENCSLAAENLMLAARAAGLGTCWIGFAQSWLATRDGKAILEIPESYVPVAPIIVGHPKSEPPVVPRNVPIIHWIG
jgi:nitroreductase